MNTEQQGRGGIVRVFLPYFKGYRLQGILAPLFKFFEVILNLLVPLVVAQMIDIGITENKPDFLYSRVILLIGLAILGMLVSGLAQFFAARVSCGFAARVRQACFDKIGTFTFSDLDEMKSSSLITRLNDDAYQVQNGVNMVLRLLLRSPLVVFGSVIMAFTIDVKCAWVLFSSVPILFVVVFGIMSLSIPLYTKVQHALDALTDRTRENLTGIRVIRAFRREEETADTFKLQNKALTRQNEFVGRLSALLNPATFLIVNLATIMMIRTGAFQVELGVLHQGEVVALYNYLAQMILELVKLASLLITLNKSIACARRLEEVLTREPGGTHPLKAAGKFLPATETKANAQEPSKVHSNPMDSNAADTQTDPLAHLKDTAVAFDRVSFSYPGAAAPSLNQISFSAKKGTVVGIIGGTGSGKTTLVNLIAGFYPPSKGKIYLNGEDIQTWPEEKLQKAVGTVFQKAVLFKGTVADNLRLGNPSAADEELWKALEIAQAADFIQTREGGLLAPVAQNGKNFSGGQKQRLTIARAIAAKPEILILDDSASALDYATEAALRKALFGQKDKTTTFLISQRTSSLMAADQILVLDNGELVGKGTHAELLDSCAVYAEIYDSQFPGERTNSLQHRVSNPEEEGRSHE